MEAPVIQVGIFTKKAVEFCFREMYVHVETGDFLTGEQRALLGLIVHELCSAASAARVNPGQRS